MHARFARRWWVIPAITFAILLAGCQSSTKLTRYSESIDACKLPDADTLALLVPGTVEVEPDAVKAPEPKIIPADRTSGDNELTTCRKVFARDLGGKQPDLNDYRLVSIAAVRYTDSDDGVVAPKVRGLMTDAVGDQAGVRLATGIGDEAGVTDRWAAARSGNVVMVIALADGGSEAALIAAPNVDNVQRVVTGMVDNLKRLYG
jgi:hypothetical protein